MSFARRLRAMVPPVSSRTLVGGRGDWIGSQLSGVERSVRLSARSRAQLSRLLSFDECPDVLRGSRLATIMRRGAGIFNSCEGSDATYQLSEEVDGIDWFISHNWMVSRWKKFIVLAVHFNFTIAFAVTAIIAGVLVVLSALGLLSIQTNVDGDLGVGVARIVLVPVFFVSLFCCRDVMYQFGHRGQRVFLDKTCIHQQDLDRQRLGIQKLGAFLHHSKRLLIVYTDIYLTKVWTVYEIAAFLSVGTVEDITVLPTAKASCLCIAVVLCYLYAMLGWIWWLLMGTTVGLAPMEFLAIGAGFAFMNVSRRWVREKQKIVSKVSNFSIRNCVCYVESDRETVYDNICVLMKLDGGRGRAAQFASQQEALDAFDRLVRRDVLGAVYTSVGDSLFSYGQSIWIGAAITGGILVDNISLFLLHGCGQEWFWRFAVYLVTWIFGLWPMSIFFAERVAWGCLNLIGCFQIMYLFVATGFFCLVLVIGNRVYWQFFQLSLSGTPLTTGAFVACGIVCPVLARWLALSRGPCGARCCRRRRRASTAVAAAHCSLVEPGAVGAVVVDSLDEASELVNTTVLGDVGPREREAGAHDTEKTSFEDLSGELRPSFASDCTHGEELQRCYV